ncbi:hypothetical protein E4U55_005249 [Claviceps digitariae]|nr:hypothetical protein E4U55_005249 [Claviceps digitariae]
MSFPQNPAAYLLGSNGPIHAVKYSATPGSYILTGSADRAIRLYNPFPGGPTLPDPAPSSSHLGKESVPQGRLIQTYTAHGYEVLSLDVASDNEKFVSAGGDRAVFLWDVATAVTTRRFGGNVHGHGARINCVRFAGEGDSLVVSGGFDTSTRIWDVKSGGVKPIQVLDEARDAITCLVVRGPEVVTGSVDGRVRSYDVRMWKCTTDVMYASVTSLDLTRDGRSMLVGTLDSKIRLMDRENGSCLRAYADAGRKNEGIRVQSLLGLREKYVVAGDEMAVEQGDNGEGRIWAWNLLTGRVVARLTVPWGPPGYEVRKKTMGKDGREKTRDNVISCMAWREDGWGDQFCVGGSSGVVTVYSCGS